MSDLGLPLYGESYAQLAPYRPEVALITDDASVAYEGSDWDLFVEARPFLRNALAKTGAQVGYYSLADFVEGTLPPCKVYIFANAWYLTDDQVTRIRARLQAEGAMAIWQYAAGYLGPSGPSVSRMQSLTGIQVQVADGICSSAGTGALQGLTWGWPGGPNVLSPRFVANDAEAVVLGRYLVDNKVSTVMKRVGSSTSVLLGDVGLTNGSAARDAVEVLRKLLGLAGVHLWSDAGDTVHTDGRLLVVHSGTAGSRSIELPRGFEARTLDGQLLARAPDQLHVTFAQPGGTQWFRLEPQVPRSFVLPSSVFSGGRNNAEFHSDVRLLNPGGAAVTVTPTFYDERSAATTAPAFTISARSQVAYDNILSSLFGRTLDQGTYGPIGFSSTGPLVVSSSVNNVNACGNGSISGQWLPGVDASQALTSGVLVQLAASASPTTGYRTNLAFMNPSLGTATISVKIHRGDGTLLSTGTIGPLAQNAFIQIPIDSTGSFPGVAGTTDTNLWLEFLSDQPVLVFASVINNASGDPFAIVATADQPPVLPNRN